jgi:hypothetical protein
LNQLPPHSPWWKKNKAYFRWLLFKSDRKKKKYGIKQKPALVITFNNKHKTIYNWENLEKVVNDFIIKAM